MPEALQGLQKIMPLLTAGASGAGLVGNILSSIQQGNVAKQAEKNAELSPTQLASRVSAAEQPLDRSLINTVNNQVQGDMAQRGLAEAPGIFGATEAQALAPFQQQNQQSALELILQQLGLPNNTLMALRSGGGGMANLSPLLQMLMKSFPTTPPPATAPFVNQGPFPPPDPGLTTPNNFTGSTDTSGGAFAA